MSARFLTQFPLGRLTAAATPLLPPTDSSRSELYYIISVRRRQSLFGGFLFPRAGDRGSGAEARVRRSRARAGRRGSLPEESNLAPSRGDERAGKTNVAGVVI